jgi:tetratricopeptide (TPR) repeat protein
MAPDDEIAINNLSSILAEQRQWAQAESLAVAGVGKGQSGTIFFQLVNAQMAQGKDSAVRASLTQMRERDGDAPAYHIARAQFALARRQYDSVAADQRWIEQNSKDPAHLRFVAFSRWSAATSQGELRTAEGRAHEGMALAEQEGQLQLYLMGASRLSQMQTLYRSDPAGAVRTLDAALAKHPLASMSSLDRPYVFLALAFAVAGQPARAQQLMKEYTTLVPAGLQRQSPERYLADGYIAMAQRRSQEAIEAFRAYWDDSNCGGCGLPDLGRAFDQAGEPDSALAAYLRAATLPPERLAFLSDPFDLSHTYHRLGELYEEKRDREHALEYYGKFTALWKDADPELQPQVREVKDRMAKLAGEQAAQ